MRDAMPSTPEIFFSLHSGDIVFLAPLRSQKDRKEAKYSYANIAYQREIARRVRLDVPEDYAFSHVAICAGGDVILEAVPADGAAPADGSFEPSGARVTDHAGMIGSIYDIERCVVFRPRKSIQSEVAQDVVHATRYFGPSYPAIHAIVENTTLRAIPDISSAGKAAAQFDFDYRSRGDIGRGVFCSQLVAQIYRATIRRLRRAQWKSRQTSVSGDGIAHREVELDPGSVASLVALEQGSADASEVLPVHLYARCAGEIFERLTLAGLQLDAASDHVAQAQIQSSKATGLLMRETMGHSLSVAMSIFKLTSAQFQRDYAQSRLFRLTHAADATLSVGDFVSPSPSGQTVTWGTEWQDFVEAFVPLVDHLRLTAVAVSVIESGSGHLMFAGLQFDIRIAACLELLDLARSFADRWLARFAAIRRELRWSGAIPDHDLRKLDRAVIDRMTTAFGAVQWPVVVAWLDDSRKRLGDPPKNPLMLNAFDQVVHLIVDVRASAQALGSSAASLQKAETLDDLRRWASQPL